MIVSEGEALRICDYVVSKGLSKGATEVEAYFTFAKISSAVIQNNKLHTVSDSVDFGVGVRVARGKQVGFSFTNRLDDDSLAEAVDSALEVAMSSPEDPNWRGFPGGPFTYASPSGTYSDKIVNKGVEDAVEIATNISAEALKDRRITVVEAWASYSNGLVAIMNSHGVKGTDKWTFTSMGLGIVANESGYTTPIVTEWWGSRISEGDPEKLVERAISKAIKALNPIKIDPGRYGVVLEPEALMALFSHTLMPALRGDNVVRGKSPLKGKEGEEIASKSLIIVDDGLAPGGLATSKFDGEGVPKRRTELIIKGVLKNFIFDTYWGRRAEKLSTGNAVRSSYSSQPRIGFSNFIVSPGTEKLESYLGSAEKVLVVNNLQGAHSSNPETGEFSVVGVPAWIVSKGECRAVKGIMIAGNVWDIIKRVGFISKERKILGPYIMPWIEFEDVRVVTQ